MKYFVFLFSICFSFISIYMNADSLWNDNASNIYGNKINYKIGDSVQIIVDEQSAISYKSQGKSLKSFNINQQGGEMTGIFNFLPKGNVEESQNSQSNDNLKIQMTLQGQITNVGNGVVTITGSKSVGINNRLNTVSITGTANFGDIIGKSILSSKLINPRISITTLIENKNLVLTDKDFQQVVLNPDSTGDKKTETRLTDTKKKELLLNYFNKILNVIF